MRRKFTAFLAAALALLLSACSGDGGQLEELRESLAQGSSVTVTAEVTALEEGRAGTYTLELVRDTESLAVTVLEPETLAGVKAVYDGETRSLEFDGLVLDMGEAQISPIDALPRLLDALEEGYETLSWPEGDDVFISLEVSYGFTATVRLDSAGKPVWAELLVDGVSAVQCDISQFSIN